MDAEVIEYLTAREQASQAARVHTYRVFLGSQEVTVQVHDHGPSASDDRYSAMVYLSNTPEEDRHTMDHRFSLGDHFPTVADALGDIQWWKIEEAALKDD